MKKLKDIENIREELNYAIDILEDVLGDYEEISEAMQTLDKVADFLYDLEIEQRRLQ